VDDRLIRSPVKSPSDGMIPSQGATDIAHLFQNRLSDTGVWGWQ